MFQPHGAAREPVELREAHHRLVSRGKDLEDGLLVDLILLVAYEHEIDGHRLPVDDEFARLERTEPVGVGRRNETQTESDDSKEERVETQTHAGHDSSDRKDVEGG